MARTRSIHAHEEVLRATLRLIAERGVDVTSVDAIAEASGVSKATIYKHWRTKEELCLEAISKVDCEVPAPNSADPRSDLVELLRHFAQAREPENLGQLWSRIVGYASGKPAFMSALRACFDEPRRAQASRLVMRAIFQGQLRDDLDVDIAPDMLFGPIMHRRFSDSRVPPDLPEEVVAAFWRANAPVPPQSTSKPLKKTRRRAATKS